jgi:class 3 adenylate cyclase
MQQIADWLGKLGLSEYAQRFAENDLEKIGIASLGHRRKLLRAIANLETIEKSAPAVTVAAPAAPLPLDIAERRQVTVMFSDLVDSTGLSARMDPEDLREVISAYQECVAEIVRRFDGFVARYMGDGVLVYFGYPQAHEDDAERAVRAGLELIAAVAGLKTHASLQTRVGIATGVVVVGDLIGTGAAQEQAVVGETPNLAARLQGLAEPNMVVIAESTRRLLGNLFELQDLGAREVKGIAGPCRSGPAPARPPWRPSAARAPTTDAGSVGLDVAPPPGRRLLVGTPSIIGKSHKAPRPARARRSGAGGGVDSTRGSPLDHELDGIRARETRAPFSRLVVTPTPHLERSCTLASQGVSGLRPPGQVELLELGKRGPDRRHAPAPGRIRRLKLEASEDALRLLELQERPA